MKVYLHNMETGDDTEVEIPPLTQLQFYNNITLQFAGVWGERDIGFNIGKLGRKWVDEPNQQRVDELLLHEFAHDKVSDHLSDAFADEIARLGAKMRTVRSSLFVPEVV